MSQTALVAMTNQVSEVTISSNFRMHTIGISLTGGIVTVEARVPGGSYEPVMDSDTGNAIQLDGSESLVIEEIALEALRFTPLGATYSVKVTSQASD